MGTSIQPYKNPQSGKGQRTVRTKRRRGSDRSLHFSLNGKGIRAGNPLDFDLILEPISIKPYKNINKYS
jgi:hypothetical protein